MNKNNKKRRVFLNMLMWLAFSSSFTLTGCNSISSDSLSRKFNSDVDEFFPKIDNTSDNIQNRFCGLRYTSSSGITLPFRIHIPDSYKSIGKGLPLFVFLHGAGERGDNNETHISLNTPFYQLILVEENAKQMPAVVIAPQCPSNLSWSTLKAELIELIERTIKKLNIDKNRVYVTGISMGGNGTFEILAQKPELFAAAMPICGWADLSTADKIKDIPIWVHHAVNDGTVSVVHSREIVAQVQAVGGEKIKYTEHSAGGHGVWTTVYNNADNLRWLFAHKRK